MAIAYTAKQGFAERNSPDGVGADTLDLITPVDVPVPSNGQGVFEALHGLPDVAALAARLQLVAAQHHGLVARDFVRQLIDLRRRNPLFLAKFLGKRRQLYLAVKRDADGAEHQCSPVREQFATIYAAGCLAIRFSLIPWQRTDLRDALIACERNHIAYQQNIRASQGDPVDVVRDYLKAKSGEFQTIPVDHRPNDTDVIATCPGYVGAINGRKEFMIPTSHFDALFAGKVAAQRAKVIPHQRGLASLRNRDRPEDYGPIVITHGREAGAQR